MATHFVGQKVRVNCDVSTFNGAECRIVELDRRAWTPSCGDYVGHVVDVKTLDGIPAVFEPHELIPIQDRNEVTTWEKCAWSPHGVSA